jgi:hypothetical protein
MNASQSQSSFDAQPTNLEAEEFRRGVFEMTKVEEYTIKISSGSNPPGLAPYYMTPSIYDGVATRQFETKEYLERVLMGFEDATQAGIESVLEEIAESGFIIIKARLAEKSAKNLGWNF